ncbi:MAG TPA: HD domain-containing protein [Candidatus Hydrogenedentes bacterium]|nr:HD domain-containing protein [Candidatus Hydrogenedentota bacterium]HPU96507.1 HD domain-containing protein [Candidatus Hydrogenedentota bacterium]
MPISRCERAKAYLQAIRARLKDGRVTHCVFVAEYFSSFAPGIGLDHDEAVAVGLLHDYCRDLSGEELLAEARRLRLPVSEAQLERPVLLHGPLAAALCGEQFGLSDAAREAIAWHTTGRPGLGPLGQGLIVADFAEPGRKYPEAGIAREILRKEGFRAALLYVARQKNLFSQRKETRDPNTAAFLFWLEKKDAESHG